MEVAFIASMVFNVVMLVAWLKERRRAERAEGWASDARQYWHGLLERIEKEETETFEQEVKKKQKVAKSATPGTISSRGRVR
jgi:hypothetical protein